MAKRNFKVYADVGATTSLLSRKLRVLDTGAGPNCIRKSKLPPGFENRILYGPLPNVNDANNNPIQMLGLTDLVVRLGPRLVKVTFIACERLAAPVILGCDFCDRFDEAILPRKREVELDDGTRVPITRKPLKRPPSQPPPPAEQEYGCAPGWTSPNAKVAKKVVLPAQSQTWVEVLANRQGVNVLQPLDTTYQRHSVCASNGVVQVEPNKPFKVLVANFSRFPKTLPKNQIIATLLQHPTAVLLSQVALSDVLGIAKVKAAKSITKPKRPERTDPMSLTGDKPFAVEDLKLNHMPEKNQDRIRALLERYAHMWDGSLGEISATEHLSISCQGLARSQYRLARLGLRTDRLSKRKSTVCYGQG